MTRDEAETLALQALTVIAGEEGAFRQLLVASGLQPIDLQRGLRDAATRPALLGGVLDFLLGDEALLQTGASALHCDPALFTRARQALPGAACDDDFQ